MLDNLCHIFKLAAYMGLIESFGIILLAYQHNGYIVIYYALSLFFWTPSFIVISMTKSRSLNVYYPHAGLLNKELLYSLFINFLVSGCVMYLFYILIYFRVEHKDAL